MPRGDRPFSSPLFEPALSRSARKAQGVYYTPPEIVRQIVQLTLGPRPRKQSRDSRTYRVLDPSCGAGEFLVAAFEHLSVKIGPESARGSVWGIDIDLAAAAASRSRLLALDPCFPVGNIVAGDALTAPGLAPESFDAVVGNPPYINIRQLAKNFSREQIKALRRSFTTARGNFDLYVLFIERAIDVLRPGGRCGLIIPSKWATLDYARECRKLLLSKTTIEHIVDLSTSRVFGAASVYPHIVVCRKAVAKPRHLVNVVVGSGGKAIGVAQAGLSLDGIEFLPRLNVESLVASKPLAHLAEITCGTAGYTAAKIARRIFDASECKLFREREAADFVTSGNIDRYSIRLGDVRYLNRRYSRPMLPRTVPELTPAKRRLFASPKIVVAGMSRRLEAAWDNRGVALGVQVYAISDFQLDPFYLLAVLNSKLLSYLFATRYAAKRLGGGYLAINKGQLARLPIAVPKAIDWTARRIIQRLAILAQRWSPTTDTQIDQLVYELYRLTAAEIDRVERHFQTIAKAAA